MALFASASASSLRTLAGALRAGHLTAPLSRFGIHRIAPCPDVVTTALVDLSKGGMAPLHIALLLDEAADAAEAAMNGYTFSELVWTGPEGPASDSRDTAVVVEELFSRAERSVIVSSYAVYQGATVFAPLAVRMNDRPELHVCLFLHVSRDWRDTRDESELLRRVRGRPEDPVALALPPRGLLRSAHRLDGFHRARRLACQVRAGGR